MLGLMEYDIGVVERSMGSLVWLIGVCRDEFRDRPASDDASPLQNYARIIGNTSR